MTMPHLGRLMGCLAGAVLVLAAGPALAREDAEAADAKEAVEKAPMCLQVNRIRRTEIVDNSTILFHMVGKKVWKNSLPHRCAGLRIQGGFGYVASVNRICSVDVIQVLGHSGSFCPLGDFEAVPPATEESE